MVTKKDRILLICVYMGKLPFWIPAFLFSCKYNQDVNWLIVSDEHPSVDMPENVKFINKEKWIISFLSAVKVIAIFLMSILY